MNVSPFPSPSPATPTSEIRGGVAAKPRVKPSLKWSLTGVCFIFGALVAMQFRTIQQVHVNEELAKKSQDNARERANVLAQKLAAGAQERDKLQARLASLQGEVANGTRLSKKQAADLSARIQELQALAGLTPVTGPGLRIRLADSPQAAQTASDSPFLPGIVHDYDILQVVNELRAAGAEAIAVNGIRITGYTPIRCVGPAILINGKPVPAPFNIEAIGDADGLRSAVTMANGIVDNLKTSGGIVVDIKTSESLKLNEAGSLPSLKVAKAVRN